MRDRLALAMAEWPVAWRSGWEQALAPAESLFAPTAGFADLRAGSLHIRHEAVRTFLGFLARNGRLIDVTPASLVVTQDNIEAYVEEQRARGVRNSTLQLRLGALHGALRMIFPGQDFTFVRRPGGHPLRQSLPHQRRRVEVRDHRELLARATALHAEGLTGEGYAGGKVALRDAAIIGLLSCLGIRLRALAEMQVGHNLFARDGCYWVNLEAANTKMGRGYATPLPAVLTPILDDYLTKARPSLGGASTPMLWLGTRRQPLPPASIAYRPRRRTLAWFGTGRGPHWFRKCITTTANLVAPELAADAAVVLDHSPQVALEHYNMASGVAAAQRHTQRMERRMEETAARAKAAFQRSTQTEEVRRMTRRPKVDF